MTDDWKKLIFENEHETLFETNDTNKMYDYLYDFQENRDVLIFENIYESMNVLIYQLKSNFQEHYFHDSHLYDE